MTSCTIVDYGCGNLFSVKHAIEASGGTPGFSSDAQTIAKAERLILPGVGAFGDAAAELARRGLTVPIMDFARTGRPMLGICVGMQLLFDWSEEFGKHSGLGLISGHVRAIPRTDAQSLPHKVPHIGWTQITKPNGEDSWNETILDGLDASSRFYFVHSFTIVPDEDSDRLADATYNGRRISAAVRRGTLYGCQFHPEKSGKAGLRVLRNFLNL